MSVSQNFPNISPSLDLSFALTKKLDPRITFARASSARYYNGVTTTKAEENLLLQSQDYSATWTVTNLTPVTGKTAPDGTSTATEFTASAANAVLTQGFTAIAGSYTFSVFLRRVTGTGDIQIAADNGTWNTKVITASWARYDITQTATAGAKTAGIRVVDSGDAIEVWGAQLEQRSALTAYQVTTTQPITNYIPVLLTATDNVARFDHNPTTGESLGLLVEEQRTNLFTRSEEFSDAAWSKAATTITANTIVAPDGTLTGDKIVEDSATAEHFITQIAAYTSGTTYTFTTYVKAAERGFLILSFGGAAFGITTRAWFNLLTGTVGTLVNTPTASITAVGNGWYRCSITKTATATIATNTIIGLSTADNTLSYTGDGYSGIYIWGAQLEDAAFPTSYIPTVASQVTRSADAASMTGANFSSWYRADEGTIYGELVKPVLSSGRLFEISDNTTSNRTFIYGSTNLLFDVRVNGTDQAALNLGAVTTGIFTKAIGAYKVNDFIGAKDGILSAADTSGIINTNLTRMFIGSGSGNVGFLNGHICKISYYPLRLTNAQLQALTS
jgi:hypothetical protein